MIFPLLSTVLNNVPHHGRGRIWLLIGQINRGEPYFLLQSPITADTSLVVASLEQNLRFAIELILFFTYMQVLGLSELGLIIDPPLHVSPVIVPPEKPWFLN